LAAKASIGLLDQATLGKTNDIAARDQEVIHAANISEIEGALS
jgi:hypothetical protein